MHAAQVHKSTETPLVCVAEHLLPWTLLVLCTFLSSNASLCGCGCVMSYASL